MSEKCQSCGMPIESGIYCQYCVDEDGNLQDFETRFAKMVAWQKRRGGTQEEIESKTIAYMSTLPAWADHPQVKKRLKG